MHKRFNKHFIVSYKVTEYQSNSKSLQTISQTDLFDP